MIKKYSLYKASDPTYPGWRVSWRCMKSLTQFFWTLWKIYLLNKLLKTNHMWNEKSGPFGSVKEPTNRNMMTSRILPSQHYLNVRYMSVLKEKNMESWQVDWVWKGRCSVYWSCAILCRTSSFLSVNATRQYSTHQIQETCTTCSATSSNWGKEKTTWTPWTLKTDIYPEHP